MLDIGWSELILIGIVALIVVGPKDLPRMFHTLGRFTGKLKAMGREFQTAMNDAARSSGLDEVRRDMNDIVSKKSLGLDALETAANKFESWDPTRPKPAVTTPAITPGEAAKAATGGAAATVASASAAAAAETIATEIAADEDYSEDYADLAAPDTGKAPETGKTAVQGKE